jgi:hypothetical protein
MRIFLHNHNIFLVNYEEDDDSNDESNWRNDYPDEDEFDEDDYDNDDYKEYGYGKSFFNRQITFYTT